jgi:hypothetical protein
MPQDLDGVSARYREGRSTIHFDQIRAIERIVRILGLVRDLDLEGIPEDDEMSLRFYL